MAIVALRCRKLQKPKGMILGLSFYLTILFDQKVKARQNEIFLILHFGQQEAFQAELYILCMYTKNRSNLIAKTKADVSSFFCWTWRVESIQDLNLILGTQWKVQYLKPVILYSYLLNTVVFRWKVNERKTIHFFVIIQRYFDV